MRTKCNDGSYCLEPECFAMGCSMSRGKIPEHTAITAEELLAVTTFGWSTESERRVVEFANKKLKEIAERVHKRLGSHCDKCGHKL